MIETLAHNADFKNDEIVEHDLESSGAGSGRFNLLIGIAFEAVKYDPNIHYTFRVYSGSAELASATQADLRTIFAREEIACIRLSATEIPVLGTSDLMWFPTKVFQAKGSVLVIMLESNGPYFEAGEPLAQIGDANVPCQIKVIEHDVDAAV